MTTARRLLALGSVLLVGAAALTAPEVAGAHPALPAGSPTAPPTCPPTLSQTRLTTPPAPSLATRAPRPAGEVSTLPDGSTVRTVCLRPPPTPAPAPALAPEHVVGGPRLGEPGPVADLPTDVPPPPDMPPVSYLLADLDTGRVLAAKNPHAWLLPASTLKTLTALVVIPALSPRSVVVGAVEDVSAEGTRVGITAGARYTVDDLLNGLILSSGNDAAYALARAYGGRERLLQAMNAEAARLGAYDTVARDPSGLDAEGQRSSAYDLALIGRAVMRLPDYRRRAVLRTAVFPGGLLTPPPTATEPRTPTLGPPYEIANHNQLLTVYPGVVGVKNGYTSKALNTYIGAVTRGGRTLIVTAMAGPEPLVHSVPALLDWGFAYAARARPVGQLVEPGTAVRPPELGPALPGVSGAPGTSLETAGLPTLSPAADQSADPAGWAAATLTVTPWAATAPVAAAATPVEAMLAGTVQRWWAGLPEAGRWGLMTTSVLAAVGAGLLGWRRLRRRPRGAFQR